MQLTYNGELMFPKDYLNALDLKGRDVKLTIKEILGKQELPLKGGAKSKPKPVFIFEETKKKFVCNVTNGTSIAAMYGPKGEDWIGKMITLYPTKTQCGRELVDCIRVRETIPAPRRAAFDPSQANGHPPVEESPPESREPEEEAVVADY